MKSHTIDSEKAKDRETNKSQQNNERDNSRSARQEGKPFSTSFTMMLSLISVPHTLEEPSTFQAEKGTSKNRNKKRSICKSSETSKYSKQKVRI